jgi:hypothetical protein
MNSHCSKNKEREEEEEERRRKKDKRRRRKDGRQQQRSHRPKDNQYYRSNVAGTTGLGAAHAKRHPLLPARQLETGTTCQSGSVLPASCGRYHRSWYRPKYRGRGWAYSMFRPEFCFFSVPRQLELVVLPLPPLAHADLSHPFASERP